MAFRRLTAYDVRRAATTERMQEQLDELRSELYEQARLHEEALAHIDTLEQQQRATQDAADALEQANVRSALLVQDMEVREQKYREQANSLQRTSDKLDETNKRLERTHRELRKQEALKEKYLRKVKVELESAAAVQQLLIPSQPPEQTPGIELSLSYVPARETGGDWIGFLTDNNHRGLSILIGDVTGHGLGPALITAGVFASVSTASTLLLPQLSEPGKLLALLDTVVEQMGHRRFFMTFFSARFDSATKILRFANAGHNLPILIRRGDDGQTGAHSLTARGNQLGTGVAPAERASSEHELQLQSGDLLLFYTDGVVENRNERGREVGIRRVVNWLREDYQLPVEELKHRLNARVQQFVGERPMADDISFVLARVTE